MTKTQAFRLRPGDPVRFPAMGIVMRGTFVRMTANGRGMMISLGEGNRYITALVSQVEASEESPEDPGRASGEPLDPG